jgi:hypothetical protein
MAIDLLALLVDGEERFAGTATIGAQVQVSPDGREIAGTFSFARTSADGQTVGEGTGALRGDAATT